MARAGVTVERLTVAAADLADEVGFEGITLAALARGLGVKDASLYAHVRGLAQLRARVTVLALAELADLLADAVAGRSGKDALLAFATTYRRYALDHPGRYTAMQQELDPAMASTSAGPRHGQLVRAVLRGYGLTDPDETDAGRLVLSTIYGFLGLEAMGGFSHHPRDVDTSFARAVDALDHALRTWPRTGTTPARS
ncbi:TetR/AcrR family transcriptional regulator [Phycicoccus sp. Root101]|uniref:TetR/AcrR family transcriptional regulator n=1 Tax=Phycicoccus sp. Root101 TaxID=1736421 RepID=UPI0007031904|nr:TetR-like C-terminal domain-containing protein [Phycicoccus sp. Root101]KQU67478.1 TetR family transcriptional regulator [Phycicoccus sp. Root101]